MQENKTAIQPCDKEYPIIQRTEFPDFAINMLDVWFADLSAVETQHIQIILNLVQLDSAVLIGLGGEFGDVFGDRAASAFIPVKVNIMQDNSPFSGSINQQVKYVNRNGGAMKRRRYRNSGYSHGGASLIKKVLKTFLPRHYSAKTDIDANLSILRDRAYDLAINSPLGAAAITTQATGVIGSGLKVFPRINHREIGVKAEVARAWARKTKFEFELWANNIKCDYSGRNNFNELQNIAFVTYLTDGDSFCVFRRRIPSRDFPYSLRLQLLEAARISNPKVGGQSLSAVEMSGVRKGSRIVNGIEVSKDGEIVAVWISSKIWNDPLSYAGDLTWQRVKFYGDKTGCRNILHICNDTRAEQFRGVPYLSPVIETLKQIGRYTEAELTQAIIKSFYSIFFVQPLNNFDLNEIIETGEPCVDSTEFKLGAGTVTALPRGVDVKAIDASNSHSSFEIFINSYIKQVGAALNLPYEVLMKNFQASYSASKAALLQAEEEFRRRKAAFINDFCAPVYEMWLDEAVATGRIDAPGYFTDANLRNAWRSADWYNENSHLLDVKKEVEGAQMRIALGLSTHERESAEMNGTSYWENTEMLAEEEALKRNLLPTDDAEMRQDQLDKSSADVID